MDERPLAHAGTSPCDDLKFGTSIPYSRAIFEAHRHHFNTFKTVCFMLAIKAD